MKVLNKDEMKKVFGGVLAPPPAPESICSVQCSSGEWKSRDCGTASTCSSSGTKVACNSETTGKEMCPTVN